jgi:hypothetical protein
MDGAIWKFKPHYFAQMPGCLARQKWEKFLKAPEQDGEIHG